jgi:RNA polymerase sigma-70 factor (ECF subfamily)
MKKVEKPDSLRDLGYKFKETRSEKVFTELYNRIRPGLYNYIFQIVKNHDDTENIISYVMSYTYNKIDSYDPKWHISTWIYRTAYTSACMELRYRKGRKITHMSDIENSENKNLMSKIEFESIENYKDTIIQMEEKKEEDMQNIRLRRIVSELPEEYRSVIEEKFFNDMKYDEIAQKLNIPLHTVKNRISRGKRIIKEMYEEAES